MQYAMIEPATVDGHTFLSYGSPPSHAAAAGEIGILTGYVSESIHRPAILHDVYLTRSYDVLFSLDKSDLYRDI